MKEYKIIQSDKGMKKGLILWAERRKEIIRLLMNFSPDRVLNIDNSSKLLAA